MAQKAVVNPRHLGLACPQIETITPDLSNDVQLNLHSAGKGAKGKGGGVEKNERDMGKDTAIK